MRSRKVPAAIVQASKNCSRAAARQAAAGAIVLTATAALWGCANPGGAWVDDQTTGSTSVAVREMGHPRAPHRIAEVSRALPLPPPTQPRSAASPPSGLPSPRGAPAQMRPASDTGRGTIAEAISAALERSARVRTASTDFALAGVNVNVARSGYLPTLQGTGGIGPGGERDFELTLSQTLYDWGKTGAQVRQAHSLKSAAELDLAAERERTALEAAQAVIALKRSMELVRSAEENLAALERISNIAAELVDGGVVDSSQLEQASVNRGEARASLEDARGVLRNATSIYAIRTGLRAEALRDVSELDLPLNDIPDAKAVARSAPAVAARMKQGDAARNAVEVARAELLPRVSAEGYVRSEDGFGDYDAGIGLRITSPTYAGLSNFQRAEAISLQADSAFHAAEAALREAEEQVAAFQSQAPTLRNRQSILTAQLASAKALRSTYEDQFKVGERTVSDLINAQADVYRIERGRIAARYDMHDLQYAAAAALGRLQELAGVKLEQVAGGAQSE